MEPLSSLIIGHLIGDYIFQNDYIAINKTKNSFVCLLYCVLYTLVLYLTDFFC